MIDSAPEQPVFRATPKGSVLGIGVVGLALFTSMLCWVAFEHFIRGENMPFVFVATVFGLFAGLSAWMIAYGLWSFVDLGRHEILLQGAMFQRRIGWSEITDVEWKWQGAMVILRTMNARIRLDPVRTFGRESALQVIELIHELAPPDRQRGWPEFVHQVALPLRKRSTATPDDIDAKTHIWSTRKRVDLFMGSVCVVFGGLGMSLALWLQQPKFASFPLPLLMLWGLLRFSTPRKGEPVPRLNRETKPSKYVTWMSWWSLVFIVGFLLAKLIGVPDTVLVACAGFGLVGTVWLCFQADKERMNEVRRKAASSLEEWQRG